MFARFTIWLAAMTIFLVGGHATAQLPGQPDFVLPHPTSFEDLIAIGRQIYEENCLTPECRGYHIAISGYVISSQTRWPGGQHWFGSPPPWQTLFRQGGAEIDAMLYKRENRPFWPDACRAMVAIVQNTDMTGPYSGAAVPWSLDIGRRITHPGLDCLGDVLAVIPPSSNRNDFLSEAYDYCIVEPHASCRRLKPPPSAH